MTGHLLRWGLICLLVAAPLAVAAPDGAPAASRLSQLVSPCASLKLWNEASSFATNSFLQQPFQVGNAVGVFGLRSRVLELTLNGNSDAYVVKVWHWRRSLAQVEKMLYHYKRVHQVLGEMTVEPIGVIEVEPGVFGMVMERIPQEHVEWSNARVSQRSLRDLEEIRQALIKAKIQVDELQMTNLPGGRLKLYDLDELASWDIRDPLGWGGSRRQMVQVLSHWEKRIATTLLQAN